MRNNSDDKGTHRKKRRAAVNMVDRAKWLGAVIGLVFGLSGCWTLHGHFEPVKADRKIVMFEQYYVALSGNVRQWPFLQCDVTFVTPRIATDLAKVQFDTIPQFVIDSLCLVGQCLSNPACFSPVSSRVLDIEADQARRRQGIFVDPPTSSKFPAEDLFRVGAEIKPVNFIVQSMPPLSETCKKRDVQVMLYARLLDRVSGRVLAQEARKVQFEISNPRYINAD